MEDAEFRKKKLSDSLKVGENKLFQRNGDRKFESEAINQFC